MNNETSLRIMLAGYGKMGKLIGSLAEAAGHEVVAKINDDSAAEWSWAMENRPDVCIEFTRPDAAFDNIRRCIEHNIPVVSGTTGWYAHLPEVKRLAERHRGAVFYASNFSMGVNMLFRVNQLLASMMSHFPEYHCTLHETHHVHKLDAPSGTAIQLAEGILSGHRNYRSWKSDADKEDGVLPVHSVRESEVPGMHTVKWLSATDEIVIHHEAHNRRGFAGGALMAAAWLQGKIGVFTMDDLFKDLLSE